MLSFAMRLSSCDSRAAKRVCVKLFFFASRSVACLLRNADSASLADKSLAHSAEPCTPRTLSLTIFHSRCHGTTIAVKIAARCHAPQNGNSIGECVLPFEKFTRGDAPRRPPATASRRKSHAGHRRGRVHGRGPRRPGVVRAARG